MGRAALALQDTISVGRLALLAYLIAQSVQVPPLALLVRRGTTLVEHPVLFVSAIAQLALQFRLAHLVQQVTT